MASLISKTPATLRFLLTEDIYKLNEPLSTAEGDNSATSSHTLTDAPLAFDYEGENNRYTLILYSNPNGKSMPDADRDSLKKILEAKKQRIDDVALLNIHQYPTATFETLKQFFVCKNIILLGIAPGQIGIQGVSANTICLYQGVNILASFSFTEMNASVDKKRAFWGEMKKI